MKRTILICSCLFVALFTQAQLPWNVSFGGKTILQTRGTDETANRVRIKTSHLSSSRNLVLSYRMPADEKDWKRTLLIDDSNNAGVLSDPPELKRGKLTASFTISGKKLKELLTKYRVLKFRFASIPSDPKKAMLVRMSPIHICTIYL